MKRVFIFLFTLLLVTNTTGYVHATDSKINVSINGQIQQYEQPPVSVNGKTLVPLRGIFESLGATIKWEGSTRTVYATKGDTTISIQVGASVAQVNGQTIQLVQPAEIINGSTMVPVRFVSEALGATVNWDGDTRTVIITSNLKDVGYSENIQNDVDKKSNDEVVIDSKDNNEINQTKNYNEALTEDIVKAVKDNNISLVKAYLWKNANPNATGLNSVSVLSEASIAGNIEIVKALLEAGADPNNMDDLIGAPPIVHASKKGNVEIVKLLLEAGADPNLKDDVLGITAISEAIAEENTEIVNLLMDNGARIDIANNLGLTPLLEAAKIGNVDIFKILIEDGEDINSADENGTTPLMYAAGNGKEELVKYLLENGALPLIEDNDGNSTLVYAVASGNLNIVKILLASDNSKDIGKYDIDNSLMYAAREGEKEIVELLLSAGANPNYEDGQGTTPLMEASANGDKEIVETLLNAGAIAFRANNSKWTALMFAASEGNSIDVAKLLIENNAYVNSQNNEGYTPLILAAEYGNDEMIDFLLASGANNKTVDNLQRNAFMHAVHGDDIDSIMVLFNAGTDINAQDSLGYTPLLIVMNETFNPKTAKLLIELGADLNVTDNNGMTPLTTAAYHGQVDLLDLLLKNDVDLKAMNQGKNAMTFAEKNGSTEIVKLLKSALNEVFSAYEVTTTKTNNSTVKITGNLLSDITWVWVKVSNSSGFEKDTYFKPKEKGKFDEKIYLNGGKGTYTINILETTEQLQVGTMFYKNTSFIVENSDSRNRYLIPSVFIESDSKEIIDLANEITVNAKSDRDKSKAIFKWVAYNIRFEANEIIRENNNYSALDTLHVKTTNYIGYSRLTAALHRAVGIPAKIIIGEYAIDPDMKNIIVSSTRTKLSWNEVLLDGNWVTVDAAGGAGLHDGGGIFSTRYNEMYFDPYPDYFNKKHKKLEELIE